jgi:hypothetical protein
MIQKIKNFTFQEMNFFLENEPFYKVIEEKYCD